jgi:precorrin-2 dehydrogenase/sirohydrochlorin ferrochelatase
MYLYPIFLKLEGHKVLIVGGGLIAEQKIEAVLRSATDVTVISPQISSLIQSWREQGRIKHLAQEFQPGMTQGYFLVISCTDSETVNRAVYKEARDFGILANAVDDPGYCDFYAPAVVSRGDFQIAISTGGNSPALAQSVRKNLEQEFGPEYESWAAWLGRMRAAIRSALPRTESRKELLHTLALFKPAKFKPANFSNQPSPGGNHGLLEKSGVGEQTTAGNQRASA